jgi:hypothetical protein
MHQIPRTVAYLITACALISFCPARPAAAQVTVLMTADVTSITAGQSVTLTVTNSDPIDQGPFPGQQQGTFTYFGGAGAFFYSGDGQALGETFGYQGSETFTYLNAGMFTPRATGEYSIGIGVCDSSGCRQVCGICGGGGTFDVFGPAITVSVPEPSTWAMLLLGFAGLGFAFHRSRRKPAFA